MYCLWPLPHILLVCTTLVCVLFVATPTYTISVYYFSMCTVCGHFHVYYFSVYYFSMCVYPCSITICCISAYTIIIWLLQCTRRGEGSPWMTASYWRQKQFFSALAFQPSLLLFKQLQIGSTCVLFVATPLLQIGYSQRRGESQDNCLSLEVETNFFHFSLAPFILAVPIGHS